MVLWFYALTFEGKSIDVHASSLLIACSARRLRSAARVNLDLLDVDPAKDCHQLVRGRALLGGAGCGGLAESVGRLIQDARLYAGFLELVAQRLLNVRQAVFFADERQLAGR